MVQSGCVLQLVGNQCLGLVIVIGIVIWFVFVVIVMVWVVWVMWLLGVVMLIVIVIGWFLFVIRLSLVESCVLVCVRFFCMMWNVLICVLFYVLICVVCYIFCVMICGFQFQLYWYFGLWIQGEVCLFVGLLLNIELYLLGSGFVVFSIVGCSVWIGDWKVMSRLFVLDLSSVLMGMCQW